MISCVAKVMEGTDSTAYNFNNSNVNDISLIILITDINAYNYNSK